MLKPTTATPAHCEPTNNDTSNIALCLIRNKLTRRSHIFDPDYSAYPGRALQPCQTALPHLVWERTLPNSLLSKENPASVDKMASS